MPFGINLRTPQLAAVPRHAGLLPLHPGQMVTVVAEAGIPREIQGLMQKLWAFTSATEVHAHQLIETVHLPDADPTLPLEIEQTIGESPVTAIGELFGLVE